LGENYSKEARTAVRNRQDSKAAAIVSSLFFRLLGTPLADKRQVLLVYGHGIPFTLFFEETLDWLEHYLGRVK
jgi:hypothetical protein